MSVQHLSISRMCCLGFIVIGFNSTSMAQENTVPEIDLSTNKITYQLYEPIVLKVMLTNTSSDSIQFGPISVVTGRLRFRIFDPKGQELSLYSEHSEGSYGWAEGKETATPPGRTESKSLLLSMYYPIGAVAGTYRVEVGFELTERVPTERPNVYSIQVNGYQTEETSFNVISSGSLEVDEQILKPFGESIRKIRNDENPYDETIREALERVIAAPSAQYLNEQALFYMAKYEQKLGDWADFEEVLGSPGSNPKERQPYQRAVMLYQAFLQQHPNSLFAKEARGGTEIARFRINEIRQ